MVGPDDAHKRADRGGYISIAMGLAAPWRTVSHRHTLARYAYHGIIVIEKFGSGDGVYPERRMCALPRAALPLKQIGFSIADYGG